MDLRRFPQLSLCSEAQSGDCHGRRGDRRRVLAASHRSLITDNSVRRAEPGGFTILELIIVMGLIIFLTVMAIPALNSRKSADDLTKAANTIKGVLDQARAYAQANNTYTWVGFYEEDGSVSSVTPAPDPCTGCVGRLVMTVVASKDGTIIYDPTLSGTQNFIDPTKLTQVINLVKIDNAHLPLFVIPGEITPLPDCSVVACDTFDTRPAIQNDGVGYNQSRFGELNAAPPNTAPYETTHNGLTRFPFYYPLTSTLATAQYKFRRTIRFSPTGENRINSTYDVRRVVEMGLLKTRGSVAPTPFPSAGEYPGNVLAVQIGGFNGDVKVYRR